MADWHPHADGAPAENEGIAVARQWMEELSEFHSILDAGVKILDPHHSGSNSIFADGNATVASSTDTETSAEGLAEQIKGFVKSTVELIQNFAGGCGALGKQHCNRSNSVVVRRICTMFEKTSPYVQRLDEYGLVPEARSPFHVVGVVFFVFFLAVAVLRTGHKEEDTSMSAGPAPFQEPYSHSVIADRVQLPDGRYIAYKEDGVPASQARHTILVVHSFLSSRLAGIPGIKLSLLEEFAVRLVTYDLPGFGESDPHLERNLTTSAHDMEYLADALMLGDKFWLLGYSGGGIHVWAAIKYIPERLAGAALFAPMGNPYDPHMNKDESRKIWESWTLKRKLGFILAKRAAYFLPSFYKRKFLKSLDHPAKAQSLTLGKKDAVLVEHDFFINFYRTDMLESLRQGSTIPLVQETQIQVGKWGFNLGDLQVRKRESIKFSSWVRSLFHEVAEEWDGFLGPIHIWQGTDDRIVPYPFSDYSKRMIPGAKLHKLNHEGHFSYFCFCDQCHREIFATLFGDPMAASNETAIETPENTMNEVAIETLNDTQNETAIETAVDRGEL